MDKKYAFEPALYIDAEQKLTKNIMVSYGLRYSQFYRLGASTVNYYANNQPVVYDEELKIYEKAKPIASQYFGPNKKIADYNYLEPRFAMAYELKDNQSIKLSYNRMVQYLQLVCQLH